MTLRSKVVKINEFLSTTYGTQHTKFQISSQQFGENIPKYDDLLDLTYLNCLHTVLWIKVGVERPNSF